MKVADLIELGNENAVKAAGKYRQQGRNYVVEDGDVGFGFRLPIIPLFFRSFYSNSMQELV